MTKGVIAVSVISAAALGVGVWWWFKKGQFTYLVPQVKVKSVDKITKVIELEFGGKRHVYEHKKEMAMHIPGPRGFNLTIRESRPQAEFPMNLNLIIKKDGRVAATPTPSILTY